MVTEQGLRSRPRGFPVTLRRLAGCAAVIVAAMLVSPASADVISIGYTTLSANGHELVKTGTVLAAWNANGSSTDTPTVNGIVFSSTLPSMITLASSFNAGVTTDPPPTGFTGDLAEIMSSSKGTGINATSPITFTGLIKGQTYLVQMLHYQSSGSRKMRVRFGTTLNTDQTNQTNEFNATGSPAYISTVEFVADDTSQVLDIIVSGGTQNRGVVNGIVVEQLTSIPTPAAVTSGLMLLGGCAVVRSPRRRR